MNARPAFGLKLLPLLAALLFSSLIPARPVQANTSVNVDVGIFHDALAPYGNWVNHRTYGQVWYPRNVSQNWRPYTDGYWAHTDDYGWLWVSNEPWGWAPFHYGRWAWDNWYGWIWVPGQTWAPAWVFWRSGGGYAAWAPMPPNVVWQPGFGLNTSYFNYDRDLRWDSWVAVREYNLPHRDIGRFISPPGQNLQIINATSYINNITVINNNIVNQGVPVKQIEEVTRRPVESVVPKIYDWAEINTDAHHDDEQPKIIRLPKAAPAAEEIHHNEELARRLDGKNEDGTRTEIPVANSGQAGDHEPRTPGRLVGAPAPVQAPYATPEHPNPALTGPVERVLAKPAIPETPLIGLSLDSDTHHQQPKPVRTQEGLVSIEPTVSQSSANGQPIVSVPPQAEGVSTPGTLTDPHAVSTDATLQNGLQPLEPANRTDNLPLQYPVADQQQRERQQSENLQRQQQIDQLQQELARRQDKQKQQEIQMQTQQPESSPQPDMQTQQPVAIQPQQEGRTAEPVQQIQQPEPVRQPDMQTQQPVAIQPQQVERTVEPVQQIQQPEPVRQPEIQAQQPMQIQPQQVERTVEPVQQIQQPEPVRQPEIQAQQPMQIQPQQVERTVEPVLQIQQQEPVLQPDMQSQQPVAMQPQQVERAVEPVQQVQQPELVRQPEIQAQQPVAIQPQQVERTVEPVQQMQQPEPVRQPETQNQPQKKEMQPKQGEAPPQ